MLERNRLQPPRPTTPSQTGGWPAGDAPRCGGLFVSPEDFDATGILAGVDPCESRYWWLPELFDSSITTAVDRAADGAAAERTPRAGQIPTAAAGQAARRTGSRSTAAA